METENVSSKSLRSYVLDGIESFLYHEKFDTSEIIPKGIVEIVDALASYHEEGRELFPEIILTNNIDAVLNTLPSKVLSIYKGQLTVEAFKKAIKLCAPLAVDGWVIFIEATSKDQIKYGLATSELSEVSPSLYRQLFGATLKSEIKDTAYCYIKNVGVRTVQISGVKKKIYVSFSLKDISEVHDDKLSELCKSIALKIDTNLKELAFSFFEKLISEANKVGHGTLIGVVDASKISEIKKNMDGTFFDSPIHLLEFLEMSETENSRQASTNVRQYMSILKSMINSDGITILTNQGEIVGYHSFVEP